MLSPAVLVVPVLLTLSVLALAFRAHVAEGGVGERRLQTTTVVADGSSERRVFAIRGGANAQLVSLQIWRSSTVEVLIWVKRRWNWSKE